MNNNITLKQLKNDFNKSKFMDIYHSFLQNKDLSNKETIKLLSVAILLLNSDNEYTKRLGYHILVKYSISNNNFELLDVRVH